MVDEVIKLGLLQRPYLSELIGVFVFVSTTKHLCGLFSRILLIGLKGLSRIALCNNSFAHSILHMKYIVTVFKMFTSLIGIFYKH